MVDHLVAAIAIAAVGVLAQASALVLAAASGDAVTPWVSGGGAAAAVGGLVYMAKKLHGRRAGRVEHGADDRKGRRT